MCPDPDETPKKRVSSWVKVFVVFHLVVVTLWTLPSAPDGVRMGTIPPTPVEAFLDANDRNIRAGLPKFYVGLTGQWQYWDMFAPNPLRFDIFGDALLRFPDGSEAVFPLPRVAHMSILQKIPGESFRKYYERAHLDANRSVWPGLARGVAVQASRRFGKVPQTVLLRRNWREIPRPGESGNREFNRFVFFRHEVDRDLVARLSGVKP
jgi:hypothetical protein